MSDSPTLEGGLAVILNQRSATAPYHREVVEIQGDEHPGMALGFDTNGRLSTLAVRTSIFNVMDYGAVGNDIANDAPAIQAAIDAAVAAGGGTVFAPTGQYRLTSGLNLTALGAGTVSLVGDSRLGTAFMCAFDGGSALDLTGSTRIHLANFALNKVPGFTPAQMLLLARSDGDASAGNHKFSNLHIDGTCANASVVVWGSEVNEWNACDIRSSVDKPALVCACKISELGFTPISAFTPIGTGLGGVGCNIFTACIFVNGMETQQTSPLMRLFGANAWAFYGCYSYCDCVHTIEINVSSLEVLPDPVTQVYYPRITFDCFEDEAGPFTRANKNTIYISPFTAAVGVTSRESVRGLHLRNCAIFNIYAADGTIVDNLVFDGGRYAPSVTIPTTQTKISLYNVTNSLISPSKCENFLNYWVRNSGTGLMFRGIQAAHLNLTGVASATVVDDTGKMSVISPDNQMRLGTNLANGCVIDASSVGIVTLDAVGDYHRFNFSDPVNVLDGHVSVGATGVANPSITLAGTGNRDIVFQTGEDARWCLRTNNTAEGGTADGSNLALVAFANSGATIDAPITFVRAAGAPVVLTRPLVMPSLPPATAGATGITGQIAWGNLAGTDYLFVCTATNTWKRTALATW